MALLDAHGVTKAFGGLKALTDVNLKVEPGSVHSIIGPNGAGKSTFLNVLTGKLVPDHGSVVFDGHPIVGLPAHEINQLGIARVFQTPEIYPEMNLIENLVIAALAARDGAFKGNFFQHPRKLGPLAEYAEELLEDVGLIKMRHSEARHLSRGDKRRLELAVCLAHRPRLLLLDEPTAGMSHHETFTTMELLKKISERGMTKIVIEHDMDVVFTLSHRITVLHQGCVIAEGSPEEIKGNPVVQDAYLGGQHL